MGSMFSSASSFNKDLNNWDTSNVLNMEQMFFKADSFNGDISNWKISNATSLSGMFYELALIKTCPIGTHLMSLIFLISFLSTVHLIKTSEIGILQMLLNIGAMFQQAFDFN